jgi:hypothetical protein
LLEPPLAPKLWLAGAMPNVQATVGAILLTVPSRPTT